MNTGSVFFCGGMEIQIRKKSFRWGAAGWMVAEKAKGKKPVTKETYF